MRALDVVEQSIALSALTKDELASLEAAGAITRSSYSKPVVRKMRTA